MTKTPDYEHSTMLAQERADIRLLWRVSLEEAMKYLNTGRTEELETNMRKIGQQLGSGNYTQDLEALVRIARRANGDF